MLLYFFTTATIHSLVAILLSSTVALPCATDDGASSSGGRHSSQQSIGDLGLLVNLGRSDVVICINTPPLKISHPSLLLVIGESNNSSLRRWKY